MYDLKSQLIDIAAPLMISKEPVGYENLEMRKLSAALAQDKLKSITNFCAVFEAIQSWQHFMSIKTQIFILICYNGWTESKVKRDPTDCWQSYSVYTTWAEKCVAWRDLATYIKHLYHCLRATLTRIL